MEASKPGANTTVFWRADGNLLSFGTARLVAFFAWNAQSFAERWLRRGAILLLSVLRPFLYVIHPDFSTRVVYAVLRGISRDRLDLLGEEYFEYNLKPRLNPSAVAKLRELASSGQRIVFVTHALDHVARGLAQHLGIDELICNRLDFRDGYTTGRLLDPVIRPSVGLLRFTHSDNPLDLSQLSEQLRVPGDTLLSVITPAKRQLPVFTRPLVGSASQLKPGSLSVQQSLAGKNILLVGVTGFIGKVWLAQILQDLPKVGKIYLLVRRQKSAPAVRRFEKIASESPVFENLHVQYGERFASFLGEHIKVLEGNASEPGLGLNQETASQLWHDLDVIINSSGLTDFNPDLRDAIATNVDAVANIVEFQRHCAHAGLLHLSTCYVAGARDGRVPEELHPNYTPIGEENFDAERELLSLRQFIADAVKRSESAEITAKLRSQVLDKHKNVTHLSDAALENQIRKNRIRWLRNYLTEAGTARAKQLGWPNTYTFTKSLAESLIQARGAGLPIAIIRPAIVETSIAQPFQGWNEGINTSASLSYLLGTYFRQLPSNERKRLDIVPVDTVCRGMTLIAAAIVRGCHESVYQLATSVTNPCDMARSIELTCLAHRKFYRAQNNLEHQVRMRFDTIPVSKERYQRLSAPAQKALITSLQKLTAPFPFLQTPLIRTARGLERLEKLIELFEPFILHNEHDFEAQNIEWLVQALPAGEKQVFGYDSRSLDWYDYWINIHIPALRKWTYPLIEGRPLESRSVRNFQMPESISAGPDVSAGTGEIVRTGTGATWQFS